MSVLGIIEYCGGNVRSVANALTAIGEAPVIVTKAEDFSSLDGIILPGVGAFAGAMRALQESKLIDPLERMVLGNSKPFLGICLGMQLMAESSEENGHHRGLGWIQGEVLRIHPQPGHRLPHVGWNDLVLTSPSQLLDQQAAKCCYYFDHSFHFASDSSVVAQCDHGGRFTAAVEKGNLFGVQFHPERSQDAGLRLLRRFATLVRSGARAKGDRPC